MVNAIIIAIIIALFIWFVYLNIKWHRQGERCGCVGDCSKCEVKCQSSWKYYGKKLPKRHKFLTGKRGPHGERL